MTIQVTLLDGEYGSAMRYAAIGLAGILFAAVVLCRVFPGVLGV